VALYESVSDAAYQLEIPFVVVGAPLGILFFTMAMMHVFNELLLMLILVFRFLIGLHLKR
jgi:hypothetical protein